MSTEMLPNHATEVSSLLTRWKRGEDVQDAMAHKLRHLAAGLNTLQKQMAWLRHNCRVVYYPPGVPQPYPIEHAPHAGKDQLDAILAEALRHRMEADSEVARTVKCARFGTRAEVDAGIAEEEKPF